MKTPYSQHGLTAILNDHWGAVIKGEEVLWHGNIPDCTTARDIMNMYMAQNKLTYPED